MANSFAGVSGRLARPAVVGGIAAVARVSDAGGASMKRIVAWTKEEADFRSAGGLVRDGVRTAVRMSVHAVIDLVRDFGPVQERQQLAKSRKPASRPIPWAAAAPITSLCRKHAMR